MLDLSPGLSPAALSALAELERRVVAADGGRLKLEWSTLRSRPPGEAADVLWWEGGRLLGFAGRYRFGGGAPELAGAVDPLARRRGIGTALLDAARQLCPDAGDREVLLVVPGASAAGRAFAARSGAVPHHSEHSLVLPAGPAYAPEVPGLRVGPATAADAEVVGRLLQAASGGPPARLAEQLADPAERTLVARLDGHAVGTLRLTREDDGSAGIYGVAVDPVVQGRGIGRDLLRRACLLACEEGARHVHLEVAVDNARALGLYTSLGFVPDTTEDYFSLDLTRRAPQGMLQRARDR